MNECNTIIKNVIDSNWSNWKELSTDCKHKDLIDLFSGGEKIATGMLSSKPTYFRAYKHPNFENIYAWFSDTGDLKLLSFERPNIQFEMEKIRIQLGEPEKKLDPPIDFIPNATQLIYASKGITFFWRENNSEIISLSLFPSSTVDYYLNNLGAFDKKTYFPRS